MYRIIIILGIAIQTISAFAQDIKIENNTLFLKSTKEYDSEFVESGADGGFYMIEQTVKPKASNMEGGKVLRQYDNNYKLVNEFPMEFNSTEKNVKYQGFQLINNVGYLFTSVQYPKEKKIGFRVSEIKNGVRSAPKELFRTDFGPNNSTVNDIATGVGAFKTIFKQSKPQIFSFISSKNNSKVLTYYNRSNGDFGSKDKTVHINFNMLDMENGAKLLWSYQLDLPYEKNKFVPIDAIVDNDANLYVIGFVLKQNAKKKKEESNTGQYEYRLYKIGAAGKVLDVELKIMDKLVSHIKFLELTNGDLRLAGFYSTDDDNSTIEGTYIAALDKNTGKIIKEGHDLFDTEIKQAHLTEKEKSKEKNVALKNYALDKIIPRTDGGALLVAEQYYWYEASKSTNNGTTTYRVYVYGDILVVSLNAEGKIEMAKTIHKMQKLESGGPLTSYSFVNLVDKFCFVYNDHSDNTAMSSTADYNTISSTYKNTAVVAVMVDFNGEMTRKELLRPEKDIIAVGASGGIQLDAETLLLKALNGDNAVYSSIEKKKYYFLKLKI